MKKLFAVLFVICLMICTAGCLQEEDTKPKNEIASVNLSQEQKDIVNLLSYAGEQNILFFDFKTEQPIKSAGFWVEIYENGELIDKPAGVSTVIDEAKPVEGKFAVIITSDQSRILTLETDNTTISHMSNPTEMNNKSYAHVYGTINNPVEIEHGKEIILYSSVYSTRNFSFYDDQQIYLEQPELLKTYPYVQLVKCKFE